MGQWSSGLYSRVQVVEVDFPSITETRTFQTPPDRDPKTPRSTTVIWSVSTSERDRDETKVDIRSNTDKALVSPVEGLDRRGGLGVQHLFPVEPCPSPTVLVFFPRLHGPSVSIVYL